MDIREDAEDLVRALAEYYLKTPCSCMTSNMNRSFTGVLLSNGLYIF